MYCTFVLFVYQHFPGLPASGTHCRIAVLNLQDRLQGVEGEQLTSASENKISSDSCSAYALFLLLWTKSIAVTIKRRKFEIAYCWILHPFCIGSMLLSSYKMVLWMTLHHFRVNCYQWECQPHAWDRPHVLSKLNTSTLLTGYYSRCQCFGIGTISTSKHSISIHHLPPLRFGAVE
jgi:hypothetical protein